MDIIKLILVSLLSVAVLFFITKIMGHKQVAQLDFFDYVSGITIGSIAAELATELEAPWKFLVSLAVYGIASITLGKIAQKFAKSRKYINGTPSILMSGGKIYRENLKKAKLDLSEFLMLCRESGYFDLYEIDTAVFEYNGKLTVLPKSAHAPLTPSDVALSVSESELGTELIMDGRIIGENLKRIGRDGRWLSARIKDLGYDCEEIYLAIYRKNADELQIYPLNP
jgi:uncharacterized membrane protein YcaP (DUF421 family)